MARLKTERDAAPQDTISFMVLTGVSAVVVLIGATLARAFGGPAGLAAVMGAAAFVLIAVGYRRINPKLRNTSFVLLTAAACATPFARDPVHAIQRGVIISSLLVAVAASVMLIARCADQNHHIHVIGAALREGRGGRRYLAFALASQFFSGILGLAGANLMFIMAAPAGSEASETRTSTVVAVGRGFAAASCWSPVFGNMAILLALYPTLHWIEVFPVGFAVGQMTAIVGAFIMPSGDVADRQSRAPKTSTAALMSAAVPLVLYLSGFLALMLLVSRTLHIIVTASIVLLAPVVSVLFHAAIGHQGRRLADGVRGLGSGMLLFPRLASEALLFMAAGCAGSILADAFPGDWVAVIGEVLRRTPFLALIFLMASIMCTALAGMHPVLSAVFLASTMTPAVLGLPPLAHMAAILAGWGLSANMSPFSVVSLTASRYAGIGLYQISLGKNWLFACVNSLVIASLLAVYVFVTRGSA